MLQKKNLKKTADCQFWRLQNKLIYKSINFPLNKYNFRDMYIYIFL